jgi:FkbM family methyltransferase
MITLENPVQQQSPQKSSKKRWFRDILSLSSKIHYLLWRTLGGQKPILVKFEDGSKLEVRAKPKIDDMTAHEIFVAQTYEQPAVVPKIFPKLIVDVGANIGCSLIYWANLYPQAKLIAFEPNPENLLMLYKNLDHNSLMERVLVINSALSNKTGKAFLTNDENESMLADTAEGSTFPIVVRDFFEEIGQEKIDLLKIDIEGGEYPILLDQRFEQLSVQLLVMEWHNTSEIDNGFKWCSGRLKSMGYSVVEGKLNYENAGTLWAWKA